MASEQQTNDIFRFEEQKEEPFDECAEWKRIREEQMEAENEEN